MEVIKREIQYYETADGRLPYREWFYSLNDEKASNIIRSRLDRVCLGNLGDYKAVGDGVFELRVHVGPGYRIYFGHHGRQIILLLTGGTKGTQTKDIARAKHYWAVFRRKFYET